MQLCGILLNQSVHTDAAHRYPLPQSLGVWQLHPGPRCDEASSPGMRCIWNLSKQNPPLILALWHHGRLLCKRGETGECSYVGIFQSLFSR